MGLPTHSTCSDDFDGWRMYCREQYMSWKANFMLITNCNVLNWIRRTELTELPFAWAFSVMNIFAHANYHERAMLWDERPKSHLQCSFFSGTCSKRHSLFWTSKIQNGGSRRRSLTTRPNIPSLASCRFGTSFFVTVTMNGLCNETRDPIPTFFLLQAALQ